MLSQDLVHVLPAGPARPNGMQLDFVIKNEDM